MRPEEQIGPPPDGTRWRILIVEDDLGIRTLLGSTLRLFGYETAEAADAGQALAETGRFGPHLIVLDVMLPGTDGFALTRELRAGGTATPVLFLTARSGIDDRVTGLSAGGDDYLTKPFDVEELMLRIGGILGRAYPGRILRYADLTLDEEAYEVRRGGRHVSLSPTEFRLLAYLLRRPEQILSRGRIVDDVWGPEFDGDLRIVDTYMRYLRRKVDGTRPRLIHTVRGVGYRLRLPREQDPDDAE